MPPIKINKDLPAIARCTLLRSAAEGRLKVSFVGAASSALESQVPPTESPCFSVSSWLALLQLLSPGFSTFCSELLVQPPSPTVSSILGWLRCPKLNTWRKTNPLSLVLHWLVWFVTICIAAVLHRFWKAPSGFVEQSHALRSTQPGLPRRLHGVLRFLGDPAVWVPWCHRHGLGNSTQRADPKLECAFTGCGSNKRGNGNVRYSKNPMVTFILLLYQV